MPDRWIGTVDERLARLDKVNRRCDGNTRACSRAAVEEFDLWPADGNGNKLPDAKLVSKKSCSRHRIQFTESGMYVFAAMRPIKTMDPRRAAPQHSGVRVRFGPNDETARRVFIKECTKIDPQMFRGPSRTTGELRTGGSVVHYPSVKISYRNDKSASITARTAEANDVLRTVARALGIEWDR